jgi:hypothetical protein
MARVGLVGVQAFVWITLFATLMHLDLFHLESSDDFARGAAWLWLFIYIVEPPVLLLIYLRQLREPGEDPPRQFPTPVLFNAVVGFQSAVVLLLGIGLFVIPGEVGTWWPWALTPLTARAISAWLIGLGLVMLWAVKEGDWRRLRPAIFSYVILGALQLLALVRFSEEVVWDSVRSKLYLAFLVLVLGTGLYGAVAAWRTRESSS